MSYNVRNRDLDNDVSVPARFDLRPPFSTSDAAPLSDMRHSDHNNGNNYGNERERLVYDMKELTWENGQLVVNGLGPGPGLTRASSSQSNLNSTVTAKEYAWEKPRAAIGTLESIVDLATHKLTMPWRPPERWDADINVPLLHRVPVSSAAEAAASGASDMDALVPCGEEAQILQVVPPNTGTCADVCGGGAATRVEIGEGSVMKRPRVRATRVALTGECSGGCDSRRVSKADTCEWDSSGGLGLNTASFCSQGRSLSLTCTEKPASNTNATTDDDSACFTRPQGRNTYDQEDKKKGIVTSSLSTKRSRAAIHNQSERKRRETINQKLKTLQKMVPNSNKTDKASMLDEVIDYLKQLKVQVHMMMMSRMSIPSMVMPQHPLHMSMMPPMGMPGMGTGMPMGMNTNMNMPMGMDMGMNTNMNMNMINSTIMAHQNLTGMSPVMNPTSAFMPTTTPWDASSSIMPPTNPSTYLAHSQSQPMTMEAYSRMVALIQQQQQQQQQLTSTTSKNLVVEREIEM